MPLLEIYERITIHFEAPSTMGHMGRNAFA